MLNQVLHHRLAQNGHHRLGQVFRQRANPCALTLQPESSLLPLNPLPRDPFAIALLPIPRSPRHIASDPALCMAEPSKSRAKLRGPPSKRPDRRQRRGPTFHGHTLRHSPTRMRAPSPSTLWPIPPAPQVDWHDNPHIRSRSWTAFTCPRTPDLVRHGDVDHARRCHRARGNRHPTRSRTRAAPTGDLSHVRH